MERPVQSAIIIVVVALALLYLVHRKVGIKGEPPSCGSGCSECGSAGGCGEPNIHVMRAKAVTAKAASVKGK